jgi:hypothetical protein
MSNEVTAGSGKAGYYARRREPCSCAEVADGCCFQIAWRERSQSMRLRGQPLASGGVYPSDKSHVVE